MMSNNLFVNVTWPIAIKLVIYTSPRLLGGIFVSAATFVILAVLTLRSRANPWLTFYYLITMLRKTATQLNV